MNIQSLIRRRIAAIKDRLAELANVDVGEPGNRFYRQSELAQERANLGFELGHAQKQLEQHGNRDDRARRSAARKDLERFLEAEIKDSIKNAKRFADKLEREGNCRQARIWRESIPGIPEAIYRREGLIH